MQEVINPSKSRNGDYHTCYHYNHCKVVRITTEDVHIKMENILKEIKISSAAKKLYDTMIRKILAEDNVSRKRPVEKIDHDISVNEQRIHKLEDSFADGLIDAAALNRTVFRYKDEISKLQKEKEQQKDTNTVYE